MITPLQGTLAFAITDLAKSVSDISVAVVGAASILLIAFVLKASLTKGRWPQLRRPIFTCIVAVVTITSITLAGAAIVLNLNSATGGPVRWQAAYQVWACDNQLDLRDSRGLMTDRIGTPRLFERNDGRIHVEGTPMKLPDDASLGAFMQAIGGEISDTSLLLPVNDTSAFAGLPNSPEQVEPYLETRQDGTYVQLRNSQQCNQAHAEVQAFVHHYSESAKTYFQTKLDHPANYEIAHASNFPGSDCIIVEFAPPKQRTTHTCREIAQIEDTHE